MDRWKKPLVFLLSLAVLLTLLVGGTLFLGRNAAGHQQQLLEAALVRGAVECYALEGFYPPDLAYLTERYGVATGGNRFVIHYQYIASNLMPNITVIPR